MKTISVEFNNARFVKFIRAGYTRDNLVYAVDSNDTLKIATIDGTPICDVNADRDVSLIGTIKQNTAVVLRHYDSIVVYKCTAVGTMSTIGTMNSKTIRFGCVIEDNDIWYINENFIVVRAAVEGTDIHKTEILDAMEYAEIMGREIRGNFQRVEKLNVLGSNLLITYYPVLNAIDPSGSRSLRMEYATAVINYKTGELLRILQGRACVRNATGDRALIRYRGGEYYDVLTGQRYSMPKFDGTAPELCYIGDEIVCVSDAQSSKTSERAYLCLGNQWVDSISGLLLIGPSTQSSKPGFYVSCPSESKKSDNLVYCDSGKIVIMRISPSPSEYCTWITISGLIIESIEDLEVLASTYPKMMDHVSCRGFYENNLS